METTNTYIYNGRNQLLTVEQTVGGAVVSKTEYTYDANGNQLSEIKTENGTMITVLANTYDLRNQLVRSKTLDTVINNTYNAAGYRVGKSVTKDGKTTETYFLYDGGSVIMEADASGEVTAKNTYGGPLLMRTVYGEEETTYEYMYNAHGDVVTLLSDGAVAATYYYDAFGNILDQTGEADNSILYAGYQYDEETGLYYVNARMYDPVTARFLQADTYLGNLNDPLSLNLYTYCLNNPQKYIDPSGHIPLPLIIAALVGFAIGAGGEIYTQVVVEERYELDVKMILFEGAFNAVVAVTGAWGASIGAAAARQAGKLTMRMVVNTVAKEAALGALEGASHSILRQFAEGKNMNQVNMGRVWSETVSGGLSGAFGGIIGVGADAMKQARTAVSGNVAKNARVLDGVDEIIGSSEGTLASRNINGQRTSKYRILTSEEIEGLKADIKAIGADPDIFRFNEGYQTGYSDRKKLIYVRGDVLPDMSSPHPRDMMSSRAALAHEYYGHKHYDDIYGEFNPTPGSWNDEFRASYNAALSAPNLSVEDRAYLMGDALERAKEAGVNIKITNTIRRVLYGY